MFFPGARAACAAREEQVAALAEPDVDADLAWRSARRARPTPASAGCSSRSTTAGARRRRCDPRRPRPGRPVDDHDVAPEPRRRRQVVGDRQAHHAAADDRDRRRRRSRCRCRRPSPASASRAARSTAQLGRRERRARRERRQRSTGRAPAVAAIARHDARRHSLPWQGPVPKPV